MIVSAGAWGATTEEASATAQQAPWGNRGPRGSLEAVLLGWQPEVALELAGAPPVIQDAMDWKGRW